MENEVMNNVVEEVMENENVELIGTQKSIAGATIEFIVKAGIGYAIGKGVEKVIAKIKTKKKAKINIPDDISNDKIDEIPE